MKIDAALVPPSPERLEGLANDLRGMGARVVKTDDPRNPDTRQRWSPGEPPSHVLDIRGPGGMPSMSSVGVMLEAVVPFGQIVGKPEIGTSEFRLCVRVWPGMAGGGPRPPGA